MPFDIFGRRGAGLTRTRLAERELERDHGAATWLGAHVAPASHTCRPLPRTAQAEMPGLMGVLGFPGGEPASVVSHLEPERLRPEFHVNIQAMGLSVSNRVHDGLPANPEGGVLHRPR